MLKSPQPPTPLELAAPERVIAAAVRCKGEVFIDQTHPSILIDLVDAGYLRETDAHDIVGLRAEGFWTSHGRYVSRTLAHRVAMRARQMAKEPAEALEAITFDEARLDQIEHALMPPARSALPGLGG
ncbi:MAG: hypothetical protein PHE83_19060 [Opitutaceae bacterium]|nr:hypothetical protein [Opitutaceae bacterium]